MNLFDYLEWRGDVPFSVDPFNEADNMVLSELAYTKLGGIVPGDGTAVPIRDVCTQFFTLHTTEEVLAEKNYTAKAALMMPLMAEGARFRDTRMCLYSEETSEEAGMQFAAVTFLLGDGSVFAAFRGTDGTLAGWKEDFRFSYLSGTEGQLRAAEYLSLTGLRNPGVIRTGGHSKGGNLAVYAAACCDPRVQERIEAVWDNDGPGFRPEFLESEGYRRIRSRITFLVPEKSVIGMLMDLSVEPKVVKSIAGGAVQHDGFTWQVRRNRFEEGTLSETSRVVNRMLDGWMEQMSDSAREELTENVFALLGATGAETIEEMNGQRLKTVVGIMNTAMEMPRENKQEMGSLMSLLKASGKQAAADVLQELAAEKLHAVFNRGSNEK